MAKKAKARGPYKTPYGRKACRGLKRRGHKWCPCRDATGRFAPKTLC